MNSEQLKQIILKHPYLMKITPTVLFKCFSDANPYYPDGIECLDYSMTYGEQGLDDLNIIEMIMNIEKELNISIHDEITDTIFNTESYPINISGIFSIYREERLLELGI